MNSRRSLLAVALVVLAASAFLAGNVLHAQAPGPPTAMERAITAAYERLPDGEHEDRTWEDGEAAFLQLVADYPESGEAYYHLACCYGRWAQHLEGANRARRLQQAVTQLTRAVELGFSDTAHLSVDPDLALVRELPVYADLVQRIEAAAAERGIEQAQPLSYLTWFPAAQTQQAEGEELPPPLPLLVVLHEDGSSPAVERGAWEMSCAAAGWAWLGIQAPRQMAQVRGQQTYGWSRDNRLVRRIQLTIEAALAGPLAEVADPAHLMILGYRQGAYWALATVLANPDLATDVLLINAALDRTTFPVTALRDLTGATRVYAASTPADTLGHDACRDAIENYYCTHIGLRTHFESLPDVTEALRQWPTIYRTFTVWQAEE